MALPGVEAEGVPIDVERARAYVLAHGTVREQARLAAILDGVAPVREVVRELEGLQNPDGGFPLRLQPGGPSSLDATCLLLDEMKGLKPLAGSPMASRALAFLRRNQRPDGAWQEPPGAVTGLTANVAYTLLVLEPGHLDPIRRGEAWLRRALAPATDGATGPVPAGGDVPSQTLARADAVWHRLDGPASAEAARCWDRLLERKPDGSELARWLSCALEMGVGGRLAAPLVRWLSRLAALQAEDGAWPAPEPDRVGASLQALRVLRGYGII